MKEASSPPRPPPPPHYLSHTQNVRATASLQVCGEGGKPATSRPPSPSQSHVFHTSHLECECDGIPEVCGEGGEPAWGSGDCREASIEEKIKAHL